MSDSDEETQEAPSNPEEEIREASSDPEKETKDAAELTDSGGPVVPAFRKLTISGNLPPIMPSRTRSRRVNTGVEGAALQSFLLTTKEGDEESTSVCDGGGPMALQVKVDIQQSIVGDMLPESKNRKQATDSPELEEWWKAKEVVMLGMVENCVGSI